MAIYRQFLHAMPEYLARYYWWACLWRWGIWFFDHQPIINAILFNWSWPGENVAGLHSIRHA